MNRSAQYYDRASAQFLSRDPAVALTRSPYAYVYNSPLNGADPSGLFLGLSCDICGDAASAVESRLDAVAPVVSKVAGGVAGVTALAAAGCAVIAAPTVAGEAVCGGIETVSLAAGGVATASDVYLAARGRVSWSVVGLDALALGSGGLARVGSKIDAAAAKEYPGTMGFREYANAFAFGISGFAWAAAITDAEAETAGLFPLATDGVFHGGC